MEEKRRGVSALFAWAPCLLLATLMSPVQAATSDDEVLEEVVVTGSYIRRDNFDVSSPIDLIGADNLSELGAPTMGEAIFNQSFNYGVERIQNSLAINPSDSSNTYANIRGLGTAATLDLMNNKRGHGNANYGYPQIAVQRIETLLDGASAIYGSNAVAGVVNYVPYTDFDGFKVKLDYRSRDAGGHHEKVGAMMFGSTYDRGNFVAAYETRDRSPLRGWDIPDVMNAAAMFSYQGHPGRWLVPGHGWTDTNADGLVTANEITSLPRTGRADPNCGRSTPESNTDLTATGAATDRSHSVQGNNRLGWVNFGTYCMFEFGEFWDQSTWREQDQFYIHADYEFTDRVRFIGELNFNRSKEKYRNSPINSGASYTAVEDGLGGAVIGDHPGNPFRAFLNLDASRGYNPATDRLLFASDVCTATSCAGVGDGVPDRDADGDGIPDPGVQMDPRYAVVLAADPFSAYDAATAPNGGVPFNYDVGFSLWRPIGKDIQGRPSVLNPDGSSNLTYKYYWTRYIAEFEINVGENWIINTDYIFTMTLGTNGEPHASTSQMILGMLGRGGEDGQSWYNPFSTSQYRCVDYVCEDTLTPEDDPAYNKQDVVDRVAYLSRDITNTYSHTYDFIMSTSELWEVPWVGAESGLAFGLQWRNEETEFDPEEGGQLCDRWNAGCQTFDYWGRDIMAYFFELSLPMMQNDTLGYLELNLAGRHTDVEDVGTSFDPKVGLLYQPLDNLSIRASWGTSFIAPTLNQVNAEQNSALHNVGDSTCAHVTTCDPGAVFVLTLTGGNPDLEPETADTWNVGFTLLLLEGDLSIQGDYTRIEFTDRITSSNGAEVIAIDYKRFLNYLEAQCPGETVNTACSETARNTWISTPGLGSSNIIRTPSGDLDTLLARFFNASFMNVSSVDMRVNYNLDTDWGNWIFGLQGSYILEWEFQLSPIQPKYDGVGLRNDFTATVDPLPELRLESRTVWALGNHKVALLGHYHSAVDDRIPAAGGAFGNLDNWGPAKTIPATHRWDLQYGYTRDGLIGNGTTELLVGANNVFDKDPYVFRDGGGFESYLTDPVGRMWYVRMNHSF